jgi:hypothetical protein
MLHIINSKTMATVLSGIARIKIKLFCFVAPHHILIVQNEKGS